MKDTNPKTLFIHIKNKIAKPVSGKESKEAEVN